MTKYLQSKPGSIEELAAKMTSQVSESDYQQKFKKELEKAGKGIGAMTPAEKKAFFNKIDAKHTAKDEEIKETVDNPYAVGMAQAMKKTGDKPPLKKSTITKAHDIAKSIKKDEMKEETLDEGVLEKILKISMSNQPDDVKDAKGRVIKKLTPKGAEKFLKSLRDPLTGKSVFDRLPKSGGPTGREDIGRITRGQPEQQLIDKLKSFREEVNEEKIECPKCEGKGCEHCDMKGYHIKEAKVDELTAAQKKLPPALQKAIKKKEDAKEEVKEGYGEQVIKAAKMYMKDSSCTYEMAAEKYGCSAEQVRMCAKEMMNKEETHSFHTNKQNQKQKDAKGEKDVVDPEPKMKKPSMNEQTAKQHSLMKSIYDVWSNSATDLEEMKKNAKYMKASKDDVSTTADAEQKKEQSSKDKDKDGKNDQLEKENERLIGQVNILKTKLENEKNKAIKPEPNPETGEVPLTVGVAYKHLKDKMKKESDDKEEQKKNKTMTDKAKTPVDTKPEVDYKH